VNETMIHVMTECIALIGCT